jgi:tRNA-(ms[2]io[6]A)-hydroxylase
VLHLASETSPEWLPRAEAHLDAVLLDHAHCEKKAAGAAVKLLFSYPHHRFLQEPLAELAREELEILSPKDSALTHLKKLFK